MSIKIKAEKEITDMGVRGYRIKAIDALTEEDVPLLYRIGDPYCAKGRYGEHLRVVKNKKSEFFKVGEFLSLAEMERLLETLEQCKENLKKVNATLKKKRKKWHGEVEFII